MSFQWNSGVADCLSFLLLSNKWPQNLEASNKAKQESSLSVGQESRKAYLKASGSKSLTRLRSRWEFEFQLSDGLTGAEGSSYKLARPAGVAGGLCSSPSRPLRRVARVSLQHGNWLLPETVIWEGGNKEEQPHERSILWLQLHKTSRTGKSMETESKLVVAYG